MLSPQGRILTNLEYVDIVELPPDKQLHDLVSLLSIDVKNLNPQQLGIDVIHAQHEANLKVSSDRCTLIGEDQAQELLCGVSRMRARTSEGEFSPSLKHFASERVLRCIFFVSGSPDAAVVRGSGNASPTSSKGRS